MLCRIMRKLFSTSRWLLNRAGLMDIFRWAPCITVSLLTVYLINYASTVRIKIHLDYEQPLFFWQSVEICKREKIPTYTCM